MSDANSFFNSSGPPPPVDDDDDDMPSPAMSTAVNLFSNAASAIIHQASSAATQYEKAKADFVQTVAPQPSSLPPISIPPPTTTTSTPVSVKSVPSSPQIHVVPSISTTGRKRIKPIPLPTTTSKSTTMSGTLKKKHTFKLPPPRTFPLERKLSFSKLENDNKSTISSNTPIRKPALPPKLQITPIPKNKRTHHTTTPIALPKPLILPKNKKQTPSSATPIKP